MPRTSLALPAALALAWAAPALAQPVAKDAPRTRPPLCAAGVKRYEGWASVPTPFDSLRMPRGEPIRVTSPEEAEAAQQRIVERAASVGANGLVFVDEGSPDGGLRRNVVAVFVRADSARSHKACAK